VHSAFHDHPLKKEAEYASHILLALSVLALTPGQRSDRIAPEFHGPGPPGRLEIPMQKKTHQPGAPRRHAAAGVLLAGILGALLAGAALALPAPGYYEVTTTTHFSDGLMPDTTITTHNCLTQEDLDKDPASVFADLPEGKSCQVADFAMEDGVIRMQILCAAPDGDMSMNVNGSYENETYQMTSDVTVIVGDQSVSMQSSIDGKRMGDC
jgi:hypothetical protein